MPRHSTEISVPARLTELPRLLAAVQALADVAGLAELASGRLQFAVEELFINTLDHGFGGESDSPVTVSLSVDAAGATLCYCDRAPAFDTRLSTVAADDRERVGGYGLHILRTLASAFRYRNEGGANRTEIEFSF